MTGEQPSATQLQAITDAFTRQLAGLGRVRIATSSVKDLALLDVYGRVARLLLNMASEQNGKLMIPEKLTQQEIAERVGASRDMVSRIFRDLTQGGYISVENRFITINK